MSHVLEPQSSNPDINRLRAYTAESEKLDEIHAIHDRIYSVRYDANRSQQDIKETLTALVQDLTRLEQDLAELRHHDLQNLELALDLGDVGLPIRLLSKSGSSLSAPPVSPRLANTASVQSSAPVADNKTNVVPSDEDVLSDDEDSPLNRSREDNPRTDDASSKWLSAFSMMKESRKETHIAKGQYLLKKPSMVTQVLDEEVTDVRVAIQSLKRKKKLPESDMLLLQALQARLKSLVTAQTAIASVHIPH